MMDHIFSPFDFPGAAPFPRPFSDNPSLVVLMTYGSFKQDSLLFHRYHPFDEKLKSVSPLPTSLVFFYIASAPCRKDSLT